MNDAEKYEFENKILKLKNTKGEIRVDFKWPIRQVIIFRDCYLVRIEPDVGSIYNENVFGVSKEGKILWQIESIQHVYNDSPYTNICQKGEFAKLSNWDGTDLTIEPYTGRVINKSFSK